MKRLVFGTLILMAAAVAPAVDSVGIASAKSDFLVVRGEETIGQRAVLLNEIGAADVVTSRDTPVRVAIPETGAAVMLSPESSMAFADKTGFELVGGGAAVSVPSGAATAVSVENLSVAPIGGQKSDTMYVVRYLDTETLSVQGFQGRVAVMDSTTDAQVAVVGPGDQMTFTVTDGVWKSNLQTLGQPGLFRMQDGTNDGTTGEEDESADRRRTGALLIGGGVVAAGAAGYWWYDSTKDDDDDDDGDGGRDRGGQTPTSGSQFR